MKTTEPQMTSLQEKVLKYENLRLDGYPPEIEENVHIFFSDLNNFSASNELIQSYLGRPPSGMVMIPWNTLHKMVHSLIQPTLKDHE